jgi:predicted RNA-binding protein
MCLAHVKFAGNQKQHGPDALSDVAWIERTPGRLRVTDLFGNTTELKAEIRSIDFVESVVSVEKYGRSPADQ